MKDTRKRIINAASDIFNERGIHGARMEEISAKAKVNKAMVYYYFNSKENLFREVVVHVLTDEFQFTVKHFNDHIKVDSSDQEIFEAFAGAISEGMIHHMKHSKIIIEAMTQSSEQISESISKLQANVSFDIPKRFVEFCNSKAEAGLLRKIDYKHILVNIIGMSLIHFISKPLTEALLNIRITNEKEFLNQQKKSIVDMLMNGIFA